MVNTLAYTMKMPKPAASISIRANVFSKRPTFEILLQSLDQHIVAGT